MTTYLTRVMSAIKEPRIAKYWIGYFRENFRGEINDRLLEAFQSSGITKADIARKLERRPEQVTRWLSAPCNLEVDTISDIALSLGLVPKIRFERAGEDRSNGRVHEFILKSGKSIVEKTTEAQKSIYSISTYDTTLSPLSRSTVQHSSAGYAVRATNEAYMERVSVDA